MRAERRTAVPESPPDYVSEEDLRELELDPEDVRHRCPWAVELTGLDGRRCWLAADLNLMTNGGDL